MSFCLFNCRKHLADEKTVMKPIMIVFYNYTIIFNSRDEAFKFQLKIKKLLSSLKCFIQRDFIK